MTGFTQPSNCPARDRSRQIKFMPFRACRIDHLILVQYRKAMPFVHNGNWSRQKKDSFFISYGQLLGYLRPARLFLLMEGMLHCGLPHGGTPWTGLCSDTSGDIRNGIRSRFLSWSFCLCHFTSGRSICRNRLSMMQSWGKPSRMVRLKRFSHP